MEGFSVPVPEEVERPWKIKYCPFIPDPEPLVIIKKGSLPEPTPEPVLGKES